MRPGKFIKRAVAVLLLLIATAVTWFAWLAFPAISGYGAKNLCSAVYLQHRDAGEVIKDDLAEFPLSLGSFIVNKTDSSVTGSVWGFAKRKAIYRKGLGCTLINDFTEEQVRSQSFLLPPPVAVNQDSLPWPQGDRIPDTISADVNKALLQQAIDNAMHSTYKKNASETRSIVVLYKGAIVGEQYAPGFNKNTVQLGWSMSKSLIGALIGVLVKEGRLAVEDTAPVPEWKHTSKEQITIRQLLQQTTGLKFKEDYANPSEVTNMLFNKGDMAAFTAALPLKDSPGTAFNYSSGNTNILSRIIRHTVGEKLYPSFPYQALFHKINMYSMLLEPDASGTYIGSSYSYATARDFARFGLLYYNNGVWNGEQILPVNWVKETVQPSIADARKHYGYQFWLNGYEAKVLSRRWYPDVPADMYFADGYGGQDIYIIPSKHLVVVRLGLHTLDENKFLREVILAVTRKG
ncbi:serine hydrolase [Ferruginibacter paludis]|uniref:serine hydrolase domain-containing protein n=1 Tax=Ferruginibacter paludis TaxID=1310417 RepID=UPI0025B3C9B4|nr:serine hydrolase [Ferruginibacter paludis]MDN3656833.1 serine hydrolase [Ferruginibacter paludis]